MDIIRRRNNSPETHRLDEQSNASSRPGTLRRRYDHQTQRTVFVYGTRPNKRSRKDIAEIDAELSRRANRLELKLTRVRNSMRREDRETIRGGYRTVFEKLSIR